MGMRVRTFSVGTVDGLEKSMEILDNKVAGLGSIKIHSIKDNFLPEKELEFTKHSSGGPRIIRVVVFEQKDAACMMPSVTSQDCVGSDDYELD